MRRRRDTELKLLCAAALMFCHVPLDDSAPRCSNLHMNPSQAYEQLTTSVRETSLLDSIASFMSWDEHTYMPTKGTPHRANQQSLIARMSHQQFTSPRIGELLGVIEGSELVTDPHSDAGANV